MPNIEVNAAPVYVIDGFASSAASLQHLRHATMYVVEGDGNASNRLIMRDSYLTAIEGRAAAGKAMATSHGVFLIEKPRAADTTTTDHNTAVITGRAAAGDIAMSMAPIYLITTEV